MEAARAAPSARRKNLSLRSASRQSRQKGTFDTAFESFYRKHVAEVYQYALAVLANSADAEDVTQQTFLNAYRAFQRGERPRKPHNWLIKIAHNVCRMRWRQSSRRPQEIPLEHVREPAAPEDQKPSLDEVLGALKRLPFNQRAAIVMREVEDRSYSEIADVLGTSVPAVEALLFRARTNLRARRDALAGALGIAPVPASLASFFGGSSGGMIAAGGAVLGSELALKVAAVVVAGVAGGLGVKTIDSVASASPSTTRAPQVRHEGRPLAPKPVSRSAPASRQRADAAGFQHPRRAVAAEGTLRSAPTNDQPSQAPLSAPAGETPVASTASSAPANQINGAVASLPTPTPTSTSALPTLPAAPPPPTSLPVTTPVVTVTVTVPPVKVPSPLG
jgi:RNA polymerase sigma-70 factor, ECF subfamily